MLHSRAFRRAAGRVGGQRQDSLAGSLAARPPLRPMDSEGPGLRSEAPSIGWRRAAGRPGPAHCLSTPRSEYGPARPAACPLPHCPGRSLAAHSDHAGHDHVTVVVTVVYRATHDTPPVKLSPSALLSEVRVTGPRSRPVRHRPGLGSTPMRRAYLRLRREGPGGRIQGGGGAPQSRCCHGPFKLDNPGPAGHGQ